MNAVIVRIAHAEPRLGTVTPGEPGPDPLQRGLRVPGYLVVLADDAGHRALPAWVWRRSPGGMSIQDLLDRPGDDSWTTAPVPEQLAVRLAGAAGGSVTGVEIYPVTADPGEVNADTCAARIELGARHVTASLDQGLTLAVVAGAPVRVDGAVMDRLALRVPGDDPVAPFRSPAAEPGLSVALEPGERPRFEPRNMTFADGLDRWHLESSAPGDYSVAAGASCAILSSAVPDPAGSAVLVQTVFADDFRGAPVVFRGELRSGNAPEGAGLCLRMILLHKEADREQERLFTVGGSGDWSSHEMSALVPENADLIQFGIVLTGSGQVWLRHPELHRDDA